LIGCGDILKFAEGFDCISLAGLDVFYVLGEAADGVGVFGVNKKPFSEAFDSAGRILPCRLPNGPGSREFAVGRGPEMRVREQGLRIFGNGGGGGTCEKEQTEESKQ